MSRQRFLWLAAAAALIIAGALFVSARRSAPEESVSRLLLPSLATDLNVVTEVQVRKGSPKPTVTLHKTADHWTVAERADYPADVPKLRKLLVALRDARIVEDKTADPARFAAIGVQDPADPSAPGAEVTLVTPAGKQSVIIGKPVGEGSFARLGGANQSYAVEPAIAAESEPRQWIDARLFDVTTAQIQGIEVTPVAPATPYSLHRLKPAGPAKTDAQSGGPAGAGGPVGAGGEPGFELTGVPPGRRALDAHALVPPSSMLSNLEALDVAPADGIDFSKPSTVTVTLTDGGVITLTGSVIADKHWIEIKSTKDAALTAKAQGRAFEIASYRYDGIFRPVDQLLEPAAPKPAPAGKPAAVGKPAATGKPAHPTP